MRRVSLCLTAVLTTLACWGCGGSSDSGPGQGGTVATQKVVEGRAKLDAIIRNQAVPTEEDFQSAINSFAAAIAADPENAEAQFGLALATGGLAAQQINEVYGSGFNRSRASGPPAQPGTLLTAWKLPEALNGQAAKQALEAGFKASFFPSLTMTGTVTRALDLSLVRADLVKLATNLETIVKALAKVRNKPSVRFVLADPQQPDDPTASITFGHVEARLLDLFAHTFRVAVNVALAYDFDTRGFDFEQKLRDRYSIPGNGVELRPHQYLPPAPFGNLMPDGRERMATAKNSLQELLDQAIPTIEAVESGVWYVRAFPEAARQLRNAKTYVQRLRSMNLLSSAVTLYEMRSPFTEDWDDTHNARLVAFKWLDSPPPDLKAFGPVLELNPHSWWGQVRAGSYPDPQFGELFVPRLLQEYLHPGTNGQGTRKLTGDEPISLFVEFVVPFGRGHLGPEFEWPE